MTSCALNLGQHFISDKKKKEKEKDASGGGPKSPGAPFASFSEIRAVNNMPPPGHSRPPGHPKPRMRTTPNDNGPMVNGKVR